MGENIVSTLMQVGVGFVVAIVGYLLWLLYAVIARRFRSSTNFKSVLVRWRATAATVIGVASVVTVFCSCKRWQRVWRNPA